jgi:hypothetical protein
LARVAGERRVFGVGLRIVVAEELDDVTVEEVAWLDVDATDGETGSADRDGFELALSIDEPCASDADAIHVSPPTIASRWNRHFAICARSLAVSVALFVTCSRPSATVSV